MTRLRPHVLARGVPGLAVLLALSVAPLAAQGRSNSTQAAAQVAADLDLLAKETYVEPPPEIAKLVTAPRYQNVLLTQASPDRTHFLKQESEGLPSLQAFGKFHYYFGGLQVDPKANRARSLTTRGASGLSLIDATTGRSTTVQTPKGATVSGATWSPLGRQLAYIANFDDASHVFVADVATGKSVQVTRTPLLATLVTSIDWTADGKSIIAVLIPDNRGPEPQKPAVATGPRVRLWVDSIKEPERNFASLLDNPYQKALMKYYVTGQLALIDVKTRAVTKIGAPAMIRSVDASPDGQYFRVTTMQTPYSYVVQYNSFGSKEELWDIHGTALAEVSSRPLREGLPPDSAGRFGGRGGNAAGGKRGLSWMPQGPGMYYVEAVPRAGADSTRGAAGRGGRGGTGRAGGAGNGGRAERIVQWLPPFGENDTRVLFENNGPISQVLFTDDAKSIFYSTTAGSTGEIVTVNLADPGRKTVVVRQRNWAPSFAGGGRGFGRGGGRGGSANDSAAFYGNIGAVMTKPGARGGRVVMESADGAIYLQGTRYHPDYEANPPQQFVDRLVMATGQKTRLFESPTDAYETVVEPLDDDFTRAIVNRESPTDVADSYLRDMKTGRETKLTDNTDFTPEFTNAVRKRITVTRPDGIHFAVNLTLPQGYQAGTRLPAMLWVYPYEYTEQAGYDRSQRTTNLNRFPRAAPRTIEYLVTQGYAVANFSPPVIGDAGRMNDNYVADLIMNLSAVIDELDRQQFIDRTRLAIGGHSYGAFTTANALVHTPFFKAGIAGDGMYNRSLTPNGFQSERRDFWNGQKTYEEMSPFFYADKMQGALLMYHSMEDQNVGTSPISSIRMLQALRAYGKTAALFMYPYEDHGPVIRETVLDQWARWVAWLDIYVKHAGVPLPKKTAATSTSSMQPHPR